MRVILVGVIGYRFLVPTLPSSFKCIWMGNWDLLDLSFVVGEVIGKSILWIVGIVLAGLVGAWICMRWTSGTFASVPNGHDARLVRVWTGQSRPSWAVRFAQEDHKPLKTVTYELRADGTGTMSNRGSFIWGTEDGRIQMKYLAVDAWATPSFSYRVSSDGRSFAIDKTNHYLFAPVWTRAR